LKKIYLLAIIMAIVAGGAVYYYAASLQSQTTAVEIPYEDVIVAIVDIPKNQMVTQEMVAVKSVPKEAIHILSIHTIEEVVGVVTKNDIFAGEQMLTSKIGLIGNEEETLSYTIPPGMRAISVEVDQATGVSGYVYPGDFVDVVTTILAIEGAEGDNVTITSMFVENMLVLKTGVNLVSNTDADEGIYKYVTLAGTPEQVVRLHHAGSNGRLTLVLRPVLDNSAVGGIYAKEFQIDPRLEIKYGY